jgi:hypothetical protein
MKKLLILLTVLSVLGASCKKDFLSVNEFNPNSASAVPANLVLPAALNNTSINITSPDNYSFVYLWYGCWSISVGYSQPTNLTQYNLLSSAYQGNWANLYLNLQNYSYIMKESEKDATGKKNSYIAIAKIMTAYIYQNLVDCYGNIPYSEALKAEAGILKPKYDGQQAIYEDLVIKLDEAMTLINGLAADAEEVGDYDIIYHGDMGMWLKFANTLKLRILMNQSGMTGRAAYISGALATTPHTTADYIGEGEGAMLNPGYLKSAGKMNPFWENFYKQDDSQQADGLGYYEAGQDAVDFMVDNSDPRKTLLFAPYSGTNVKGNYFGALLLGPVTTTSQLGTGLLQTYDQSAPMFTDFESLFLQAEAVQKGFITGSAKALYESAVTSSVVYLGGLAADANTYLKQSGAPLVNFDEAVAASAPLKAIITQKWLALNGVSPMPIWTDYRRTGYPDFLHFTQDAAKLNATPPIRLLYPQVEISTNNDNVVAQGDISLFTSKIFWQNR